ncbi:hypothetical protein CLV75_2955 [Ruegeria conchae]|uniref:Uncharacterized protein n=1 Tax=Ruegeria conchae TaxID=981384 RepID=A0A497Z546_9RHOB|nr:hypothetical protein CLV75_2955 [Ruegeria conchae]
MTIPFARKQAICGGMRAKFFGIEVFPIPKIGKVFIPNENLRQSGDDLKPLFVFWQLWNIP